MRIRLKLETRTFLKEDMEFHEAKNTERRCKLGWKRQGIERSGGVGEFYSKLRAELELLLQLRTTASSSSNSVLRTCRCSNSTPLLATCIPRPVFSVWYVLNRALSLFLSFPLLLSCLKQ